MAPPKSVCSIYAEAYALYAQLLETIASIRKALSKSLKIKNAILYGTLSIADAAVAELVASASAIAATVASQILTKAASVASTAIEALLAPILKILMSGPETIFALVNIPLEVALKAANNEKMYLSKAKSNFDMVISIFSKWTVEFGGGKYADKMSKALPHIKSAIDKCGRIIDQLDVSSADSLNASSYFNESVYNSMRNDISRAIEITKSDPILVNSGVIEERIQNKADEESSAKILIINERAKEDKEAATKEYLAKKISFNIVPNTSADAKAIAEYASRMKAIEAKRKIDIEAAKLNATKNAATDKDVYKGILNDVRDRFAYDMQLLLASMQSFIENVGNAYVQYKYSQSATYSTYTIRNLINVLISKMIELMRIAGNGAGEAVERSIWLAQELLIRVRDMFEKSLGKYYSTNEAISATELSSKLALGNGVLIVADTTLAASVTQSLIDAINADEQLNVEQTKMNVLFKNIESIIDWDGRKAIWGVDPSESTAAPYARLLTSSAGVLATMATVGLVPNPEAIATVRGRLSENARVFRALIRHNAEVIAALSSYTPQSSPYVDELKRAIPPALMALFTIGPAAFDILMMVVGMAGDALSIGSGNPDDVPTVPNCIIAYPEMFKSQYFAAHVAVMSMQKAPQFDNGFSAYLEEKEYEREQKRAEIKNLDIAPDNSELTNPIAGPTYPVG